MLPPKTNGASRMLPCLHFLIMQLQIFWDFQTFSNSRGQRMADPIIMYQNYGTPNARVLNLDDKQIVFPEDDDSDIIIVNEDFNSNTIEEGKVEDSSDLDDLESTTEIRIPEAVDAKEYVWMLTDWSPCSAACGQTGHQIRGAVCQHKTENATKTVVAEDCLSRGAKPPKVVQFCAAAECGAWRSGQWSASRCLHTGAAITRRRVDCISEGAVLSERRCDPSTRPERFRKDKTPCKAAWALGAWSKCIGECGSRGRQHRTLRCVWRSASGARARRGRERSAGAACANLRRPAVVRSCAVRSCTDKDGVCRDTSRFCENVRAMNLCALKRYKEQCCKTCVDF